MTNVSVTTKLDKQLHRKLSQAARDRGRSEAEIVREALEDYLSHAGNRQNGENCYELAVRNKIIGAARDLPADLSANPSHFEGFGT